MKLARSVDLMLIVVALVLASALAACAAQGDSAAVTKNPTVNLELRDTQIKDAIDILFKDRGLNYTVDPNIVGKVVELRLKEVTFKQALDALCEAAELTYTVKDGAYAISPAPPKQSGTSQGTKSIVQSGAAQTDLAVPADSVAMGSGAQPEAQTAAQPAAPPSQVIVSQNASPIYYGQPSDMGYGGGFYNNSPYQQYGGVRVLAAGGGGWGPYVIGGGPSLYSTRDYLPPPPLGYVNSEVQRFLQAQYATRSRFSVYPVY